MHLFKDVDDKVTREVIPDDLDAKIDELLIQASQMYETLREDGKREETIDNLLLQASQEFENQEGSSTNTRVSSPKSASDVEKVRTSAIPNKTKKNTEWAEITWVSWAMQRAKNLSMEEI